jgi:glycosyltransferase involved in cell wall biosynthesis
VSEVRYDGKISEKISSSIRLLYSWEAKRKIEALIKREKPDIAHLHNIYHQISPSVIHSLKKHHIPMVMTLHDYKQVCASYMMLAGGKTCEACRGGKFFHCFLKKCVKDSWIKSLLSTLEMTIHHRVLKIYRHVDVFISPYSYFFEAKLKDMGFNKNIQHVQNFISIEKPASPPNFEEPTITYFGRLSKEKGVLTLIKAIKDIQEVKLKVIGEGPLGESLRNYIKKEDIHNVVFCGYKGGDDLIREINNSLFVVVPSEWNEPFALTILEAFALGKAVLGSDIGGIPERVIIGKTGLLFEPGNSADLRAKIRFLIKNQNEVKRMGQNAMAFVEKEYNQEVYYRGLMEIYQNVLGKGTSGRVRSEAAQGLG